MINAIEDSSGHAEHEQRQELIDEAHLNPAENLADNEEEEVIVVFERIHFGPLSAQVKQEEPNAARGESTFAEDSVAIIAQQNANEISNVRAPEGEEAAAVQQQSGPVTQSDQPLFANPAKPTTAEMRNVLQRIDKLKDEKADADAAERCLILQNASKIDDVAVITITSKVKPSKQSDVPNIVNRFWQHSTVQAPIGGSAVHIPGFSINADAALRTSEEQLWQNAPGASWHNASQSSRATGVVMPDQRPLAPAGQSAFAIDDDATLFWQRYDSGESNFLRHAIESPTITTSHDVAVAVVGSPSAPSDQQNLTASSSTEHLPAPNSQSCPSPPNLEFDGQPKDEALLSWPDANGDIIDLTEDDFNDGLQQSPISKPSVDVEGSADEVINRKREDPALDDDDDVAVYRARPRQRLPLDSTDTESDNGEISAVPSVQQRRRKRKRNRNSELVARMRQNSVEPEAALEEGQCLLTASFAQLGNSIRGELPTVKLQQKIPGSSAASYPGREGEVPSVLVERLSAETIKRYGKSLQKKNKRRKAKEQRAVKLIRGGSKLSNGRFKCSTCKKVYQTWRGFRTHRSVHEGIKPFGCSVCLRKYRDKRCLQDHLKTHTGSRYSCNRCANTFASKAGLEYHQRNHSKLRPFKCRSCEKKFKHKSVLRQHVRVHTGERPFRCSECPKSYATSASLFRHKQSHGSPFLCDQCPKRFKLANGLAHHRVTHGEARPFQCSRCSKAFWHKTQLQMHISLHYGQRPHACELCTYRATSRSSLRSHLRTHTNRQTAVYFQAEAATPRSSSQ